MAGSKTATLKLHQYETTSNLALPSEYSSDMRIIDGAIKELQDIVAKLKADADRMLGTIVALIEDATTSKFRQLEKKIKMLEQKINIGG